MIKPVQNYILLEDLPKKKSVIVIADDADIEQGSRLKVVEVGNEPKLKLKKGDIVLVKRHNFDEVEEDGKKYLIGKDEHITAIIC